MCSDCLIYCCNIEVSHLCCLIASLVPAGFFHRSHGGTGRRRRRLLLSNGCSVDRWALVTALTPFWRCRESGQRDVLLLQCFWLKRRGQVDQQLEQTSSNDLLLRSLPTYGLRDRSLLSRGSAESVGSDAHLPAISASSALLLWKVAEEWGCVDECELQNWKGGVVCMTWQHFIYGVHQHCHTMVGCNLRQKQLQQEQHLQKAVQALGTHLAEGSGLGV